MPHVAIEFSKGLEAAHDMQSVCEEVFAALAAHEAFDNPAVIKIRATPFEFFRIGSEPQTFVHATVMLMKGRDEATRADINRTVLAALDRAMPEVGSITVKDHEMSRETYAGRVFGA